MVKSQKKIIPTQPPKKKSKEKPPVKTQLGQRRQYQLRVTDKCQQLLFLETEEEVMATNKKETHRRTGKVLNLKREVRFSLMFYKLL